MTHTARVRSVEVFLGLVVVLLVVFAVNGSRNISIRTFGVTPQVASQVASVPPTDIITSHLPPGFMIQQKSTDVIPDNVPQQNAKRFIPQGVGKKLIFQYMAGSPRSASWGGTIYIVASFTPNADYDLATQRIKMPNATSTTVRGKAGISQISATGRAGAATIEWVDQPHVLIDVIGRGPVAIAELQAVAEGVTVR